MNRTPEFILSLIGSIAAVVIDTFFIIIVGFKPVYLVKGLTWELYWVGLFASIAALVFSCLIKQKTKTSSIALIILSIIVIFTNFWTFVPVILMLIAGVMGLVRRK